jgi:predicted amidophosphoribosyltransferase
MTTLARLKPKSSQWLRPIVDLIYPRACSLCSKPIVDARCESLCPKCQAQIVPTPFACSRCSAPLPPSIAHAESCYYCKGRKWSFKRAFCYTAYAGPAAKAARRIKQPNYEPLAIELGQRIGRWLLELDSFNAAQYNVVLPIPQHWFRRLTARYNQAEVLAEQIAILLNLPLRRNDLFRTRWTEKQGTKTIVERRNSINDSFECKRHTKLQAANVLLVDDIVTSGATAHEAASALRRAGAKSVAVIAFARGVGSNRQSQPKA